MTYHFTSAIIAALGLTLAGCVGPKTLETPAVPREAIQHQQSASSAKRQAGDLMNAHRVDAGLRPLSHTPALTVVAQQFAQDITQQQGLSHVGTDGSEPEDRLRAQGLRSCLTAENIAKGQHTAKSVVSSWMNSPGHRANILNRRVTQFGLGYDPAGHSWVLVLSKPC